MAWLLSPDGDRKEVFPQNGSDFKLAELHAFVRGDGQSFDEVTIEIVSCANGTHILVINEEGKLLDPPLPRNESATLLVAFPTPADIAKMKMFFGEALIIVGDETWKLEGEVDYIAGPALYCKDDEVR